LNFKIPEVIERGLFLVDSGKSTESTAEMVKYVGTTYNEQPKKMQAIMDNIEKVTKRMVIAITKEDTKFFNENIAENSQLLIELGVVSKPTQKLLSELSRFGVGKVTGGGGRIKNSGFILFSATHAHDLQVFCQSNKIRCIKFRQSHVGLKRL